MAGDRAEGHGIVEYAVVFEAERQHDRLFSVEPRDENLETLVLGVGVSGENLIFLDRVSRSIGGAIETGQVLPGNLCRVPESSVHSGFGVEGSTETRIRSENLSE